MNGTSTVFFYGDKPRLGFRREGKQYMVRFCGKKPRLEGVGVRI